MSIDDSRGQLSRAMKDLKTQWLETQSLWSDAVANEFEQTFLVPVEMDLRVANAAMDEAAKLLHQIRRECT